MEKLVDLLRRIGLNRYEARAYLSLLSTDVVTAGQLADMADIPRAKIYEVIRSLEKIGFALSTTSRPVKFKSISVKEALSNYEKSLKKDHERKVKELGNIVTQLEKSTETLKERSKDGEVAWVVKGRDNIYNTIASLLDDTDKKAIFATTEKGVLRKLDNYNEQLLSAAKRGVSIRILAPITDLNKHVVKSSQHSSLIQHANTSPARFFISDDEKAIIFLTSDDKHEDDDIGLIVNSDYFAKSLSHYFEQKWGTTIPMGKRMAQLSK